MSDDDNEEEEESISPNTSYSAGVHTSGEDTDGKDDTNLLKTDEDINERNQKNQDVEDNDSTEQQNNGTKLQENVRDRKRENPHTDTIQLGQEESPEDMENSLGLQISQRWTFMWTSSSDN